MTDAGRRSRKLLVGIYNGECMIKSSDGGKTWAQGNVCHVSGPCGRQASSEPSCSPGGYLAAYEAGRIPRGRRKGELGVLRPIPRRTPIGLMMHPTNPQEIYMETSLPPCFAPRTEVKPGKSARFQGCARVLRLVLSRDGPT